MSGDGPQSDLQQGGSSCPVEKDEAVEISAVALELQDSHPSNKVEPGSHVKPSDLIWNMRHSDGGRESYRRVQGPRVELNVVVDASSFDVISQGAFYVAAVFYPDHKPVVNNAKVLPEYAQLNYAPLSRPVEEAIKAENEEKSPTQSEDCGSIKGFVVDRCADYTWIKITYPFPPSVHLIRYKYVMCFERQGHQDSREFLHDKEFFRTATLKHPLKFDGLISFSSKTSNRGVCLDFSQHYFEMNN